MGIQNMIQYQKSGKKHGNPLPFSHLGCLWGPNGPFCTFWEFVIFKNHFWTLLEVIISYWNVNNNFPRFFYFWTKCEGTVGQKQEKGPKNENWKNDILLIPIDSYDLANNVNNRYASIIIIHL